MSAVSQEPHAPLGGVEATFTIMKAQKFTIWQARGKLVTVAILELTDLKRVLTCLQVLPQSGSCPSLHATEVGLELSGQATFNVGH